MSKNTKSKQVGVYVIVKFADDMPLCLCCQEEAYCAECEAHFADCDCLGPTQDNVDYKMRDGVLYGALREGEDD